MKKGLKVFLIILAILIVLVGGLILIFPKYKHWQYKKERQQHRVGQEEAFSKIEFTVPEGYTVKDDPESSFVPELRLGDPDDILCVISMQAWKRAEFNAMSPDTLIENSTPSDVKGGEVIRGPEDVSIGGMEGKMMVVKGEEVSEEWGVHFAWQDTYYMLQSDEYLYKFTGHVDDTLMFERDDLETNPCMTGFDQFINSVKLK